MDSFDYSYHHVSPLWSETLTHNNRWGLTPCFWAESFDGQQHSWRRSEKCFSVILSVSCSHPVFRFLGTAVMISVTWGCAFSVSAAAVQPCRHQRPVKVFIFIFIGRHCVSCAVPQLLHRANIVRFDAENVRLILLKCSSAPVNWRHMKDVRIREKNVRQRH